MTDGWIDEGRAMDGRLKPPEDILDGISVAMPNSGPCDGFL